MFRPVALIPHYNHGRAIAGTVAAVRAHGLPVLLVDDGSAPEDRAVAAGLAARDAGVTLIQRAENGGKGAAVMDGFRAAGQAGYSHVLQIDADGQHDFADIPRFLALGESNPAAVVSGEPIYDASIPKSRLYGRYITHFWVAVETLGRAIGDSMCGFRLYPLGPTLALIDQEPVGRRMDFDIEIIVRLYWRGLAIVNQPTRVTYPADGQSHFDTWRDNLKISAMHTRLCLAMLPRLPGLLARRFRGQGGGHWLSQSEKGSVLGIQILFAAYRLLGRQVFRAALAPVIAWYALSAKTARRVSEDFLGAVWERYGPRPGLPAEPGLASTYRHLFSFAESSLDKLAAWAGRFPASAVRIADPQTVTQMQQDPRGAVLINCHLGNIELVRALAAQMGARRMHILAHRDHGARYHAFMQRLNPEVAAHLIPIADLGPETALRLKALVDAGDWLVIAGDRTPMNEAGRVLHAPFLGRPAPFAQGPWILAHVLECPVYLLFCLKEEAGHTLYLEPFAEQLRLPRKGRETALGEVIARYAARLEHYAAQAPLQWFNFYDFWQRAKPAPEQ
ncbi:MAG: glycosyltransferase family 2 protein [Gammaproteobacteria bacterium]|nr:glycosyltransferase family 2 protein [Gammaproteobacteria bacterium]